MLELRREATPGLRSFAASGRRAVATILFVFCFARQRCSAERKRKRNAAPPPPGFGGLAPLPSTPGVAENEPIVPTDRLHSSTPGRSSQGGTLGAYLELLRPPNVTTAVGDVLAGFAVAGLGRPWILPWLLASTMCLYAGGVVLNDVFDLPIDRVERPERPIPSGRVSRQRAAILGSALLASGVAFAALGRPAAGIVAGATAACILLYDAWGKRQTWVGPVNMGLCRAGNLMLGVAAAPEALRWAWPLGGTAARLHHGRDHGEPRGGSRRKTGGRQLCSDILGVRFTGAFVAQRRWRRPGGVAGRPRPDRCCSVPGFCRPIWTSGGIPPPTDPAGCPDRACSRWCWSTPSSARCTPGRSIAWRFW